MHMFNLYISKGNPQFSVTRLQHKEIAPLSGPDRLLVVSWSLGTDYFKVTKRCIENNFLYWLRIIL